MWAGGRGDSRVPQRASGQFLPGFRAMLAVGARAWKPVGIPLVCQHNQAMGVLGHWFGFPRLIAARAASDLYNGSDLNVAIVLQVYGERGFQGAKWEQLTVRLGVFCARTQPASLVRAAGYDEPDLSR